MEKTQGDRMPTSKRSGTHWLAIAGVHLALVWGASSTATAQVVEPSAERGRGLAIRLCRNCHLVDNTESHGIPAGTPTFRGIATAPGQSKERVAGFLIQPHAPMPDIQLSRAEIDDIIAYLDMLRAEESLPPLQAPPGGDKPTLPSKT